MNIMTENGVRTFPNRCSEIPKFPATHYAAVGDYVRNRNLNILRYNQEMLHAGHPEWVVEPLDIEVELQRQVVLTHVENNDLRKYW